MLGFALDDLRAPDVDAISGTPGAGPAQLLLALRLAAAIAVRYNAATLRVLRRYRDLCLLTGVASIALSAAALLQHAGRTVAG